jgi:DNA-binding transcriptional LysR family regulator
VLRHEQHPDKTETIAFQPQVQSDDMATLKVAACRSLGIVALPGYVGSREIDGGLLVRVLPQWHAGIATVSMLLPSRRGLLPSVRAFMDFLSVQVPLVVA